MVYGFNSYFLYAHVDTHFTDTAIWNNSHWDKTNIKFDSSLIPELFAEGCVYDVISLCVLSFQKEKCWPHHF